MSPEQKLSHSISLVQTNLKAAKSALEKSNTGISDMKKFIHTQKGSAKKQLAQVLNSKEAYKKTLENHIKEGTEYLGTLEIKIAELKKQQEKHGSEGENKDQPAHINA